MTTSCACGCERKVAVDSRGRSHRFISGHQLHNRPPEQSVPLEGRFWPKVEIGPNCWEWKAARDKHGYGRISVGNQPSALAHRAAWLLAYGQIPDGLRVLHRCDNPPCVRLDHLFLGTMSDNTQDCITKGRLRPGGKSYKRI